MLSVHHLLTTLGVAGLACIVFAETGLLMGVFLPGDSLLFTAGLLAAQHRLNLAGVFIAATFAAVIGDQVGYQVGRRLGPRLFARADARVFKRAHLDRADRFFAHHGPKTVVLARFVPVVRTFTPPLAGAARMPYRKFLVFNVIGGVVWATGVPMIGYSLGTTIPSVDRYLLPIVASIAFLSMLPVAAEATRHRRSTPT